MVANVDYWYNGQIKQILKHTLRIFSNFYISEGVDENNKEKLRRVPVVHMSSDKSVLYAINKGSETIMESCPKMVLAISGLSLNNDKGSGPGHQEYVSVVNEKKWDEELGNYTYELGNSTTITRLNPVPIGIKFTLYIFTTMLDHKCQIFEQIRTLFTPSVELQTSENPLDWTRIGALTLTNVNFSSRGTNIDSSQLDIMDMTFEVDTNLDSPSLIERNRLVENIIINIGDEDSMFDWENSDVIRTVYTPTENNIIISDNMTATLEPNDRCKSFYDLFKIYNIKLNPLKSNVMLHCKVIGNNGVQVDAIADILSINPATPNVARISFQDLTLPEPTLPKIEDIIDPHDYTPSKEDIDKKSNYLILEDVELNTIAWNNLKNSSVAHSNSIIGLNEDNNWVEIFNPEMVEGNHFVRDNTNLYRYDREYKMWVDTLNGRLRPERWRISTI